MRDIKLVEVRSELAAGTRGASMGIDALKVASLDKKSDFFTKFDPVNVKDANDYLWRGNEHPYAKHIDGVYEVIHNVYTTIRDLREKRKFPIVLAGDHSTAAGTIMGIKAAHPERKLGVIWIDAHADLHSPFTSPSGNMHGMPLAMCLGIDNLEQKLNDPLPGTVAYWDKLKNIGGEKPKISPEDIVFIGVRDTEYPENYLIEKYGITNISVAELRTSGIPSAASKVLDRLKACDQIYISFDVDSLDTSISKGTGTPVPDGLTLSEAVQLNEALIKDKRVCAWEIVEVNPTLDTENAMAENAFEILESTTRSLVQNF
ncbi:arginase [Cyclobacterium plantarum]|uniref:Arginase n=1 Tax=Cyclobacterium plantarum TaxID=2716263 RepID=A0ABX0HDB3_9BACT|nr:arginase [Cyclobacterium plantarum]NHE59880.1 arginase [Cyclobacterium plantarum]